MDQGSVLGTGGSLGMEKRKSSEKELEGSVDWIYRL